MDVPARLRERNQWILWRYEETDRKVPYQVNGRRAKSNDPTTWSSFDVAHAAGDQLGFVFAPDDGLFGLDLDGCRDPETGVISDWAQSILNELWSYSEVSPSGTGVKVYAVGKVPGSTGKKVNVDEPAVCSKAPAIEVYDHGRYFAFTGDALEGYPLELRECQDALDRICEFYWPVPVAPEPRPVVVLPAPVPTGAWDAVERARRYMARMEAPDPRPEHPMDASTQLFKGACVAVGFGLDDGTAIGLLSQWDACNPCGPYPERELQRKLNEARKVVTYGCLLAGRGYEGPDVDLRDIMNGALREAMALPVDPDEVGDTAPGRPDPLTMDDFDAPGLIGEIVRHNLATALYPVPELAFAAAIALVATITGRKIQDERLTRTNLYSVGLGASGSGKEHGRNLNKDLLVYAGGESMLGSERLGSHAGLISAVEASPSILFQLDEIARLFAVMQNTNASHMHQIGGVMLQLYSSAGNLWQGDAYADRSKVKRIMCPHVCMYGCNTPAGFWASLTADNVAEGLVGRMMVFEPEKRYTEPVENWRPQSCPPDDLIQGVKGWIDYQPGGQAAGNLAGVTTSMASVKPACHTIPYEPAALERLTRHTRTIARRREDESDLMAAIWSRAAEKSAKLSLLFACSRTHCDGRLPAAICLSDVDRAIKISNWASRSLVAKVEEHVASNLQESKYKRLLRIITHKGVSRTQLSRQTGWLTMKERNALIDQMVEAGQVVIEEGASEGGRPKTSFKRAPVKSLQ